MFSSIPARQRLHCLLVSALPALCLLALIGNTGPVLAISAQERCLLDGECVENVPKLVEPGKPRDPQGFNYKICHNFHGNNRPCQRVFVGSQTGNEFANLESAVASLQASMDEQAACQCADGGTPVAQLDNEMPWETLDQPVTDFCTGDDSILVPKFYKDLYETQGQRKFAIGQSCGGGFTNTGSGVLQRKRKMTCPAGSSKKLVAPYYYGCKRDAVDPLKGLGRGMCMISPKAGNPIDVASGNKYQQERDYMGAGPQPLRFERHYNSHPGAFPGSLGWQWRHTYDRELRAGEFAATHIREDGRVVYFARETKEAGSPWRAIDPDVLERLEDAPPGTEVDGLPVHYLVHTTDGDAVESYDASGRMLAITRPGGLHTVLDYDAGGRLLRVRNPFGRSLEFSYRRDARLLEMRDPAQQRYLFEYDANDLLARVRYPAPEGESREREYLYDDPDHPRGLTSIINERGVTYATWDYDVEARAVLSEHAGGAQRTVLEFLQDGDVVVTDALGNVSQFSFETSHHLRRAIGTSSPCTGCGGRSASSTYDPATGFPDRARDFNGVETDHDHDTRGLEIRRVEAVGTEQARVTSTTWHPSFRKPLLIEAAHLEGESPAQTTRFTYTNEGLLLTRTITDVATGRTRTTTWTYTDGSMPGVPAGLVASMDGPRTDVADVTTFTYHADGSGNLHTITNAEGHKTTYTHHDAHGRPTRWLDANGLETLVTYDERGRLLEQVSDGRPTRFVYDAAGNLTRLISPNGNTLAYDYDDANRLIRIEDTDGNSIHYTLDEAGNRIGERVEDAQGTQVRAWTATYNVLGRLQQRVQGENQTHDYLYDPQGNLITYTDALQRPAQYDYDLLNRMRQNTAPDDGVTRFEYDPRDNLTKVTDPRSVTTHYLYNGLDDRLEERSPDAGTTYFSHDEAGNVLSRTDARGITVDYTYDALNRVISREYPDSTENVGFTYDTAPNGVGRLASVNDASGTTTFEYDLRGNISAEHREVRGVRYTTQYAYDDLDRMVAMTYPSGREVTLTRDLLGRVTEMTLDDQGTQRSLASGIKYEPFGPRRYLERGNGLTEQRTYDHSARLVSLSSPPAMERTYDYDANDNITEILELNDPTRDQHFDYDPANRLTGATGIYGVLAYDYDAVGNRLSRTDNGVDDMYQYEQNSNRLIRINGPGATVFQYDEVGNTITRGTQTLAYNNAGRLGHVEGSAGTTDFIYNAFGERITRDAAGEQKGFIFDASGMMIAEIDGDGSVTREYVYLDGAPFALMDTQADEVTGYRLTQAATEDTPELELTLDLVAQSINLTEGTTPPRLLTHDVNIDYSAEGRITAAAPLDQSGWVYVALPDLGSGTPMGSPVVVVYEPPGAQTRQLVGIGDGTQAKLSMTDQASGESFQMVVDSTAQTIALLTDNIPVTELDLSNASWAQFDIPPQGLQYLVVSESSAERLVFLWMVKTTDDLYYKLAGLTLRQGYETFRVYTAPSTEPLSDATPAEVQWYQNDHLGTPNALTNSTGTLEWEVDLMPFGTRTGPEHSRSQNVGFPGQFHEGEQVGIYNYQRYYDPSTGRYLRSDPIGLDGGINTYAYVDGNPIRWTDPYGLSKFDKLFGLPKAFWNWYHRQVKRRGDPDATKEEAEALHEEWKALGKPKPDNKGKQGGFADPELLLWLIPWHITPTELGAHPCEMPGGPPCGEPVPPPDRGVCE